MSQRNWMVGTKAVCPRLFFSLARSITDLNRWPVCADESEFLIDTNHIWLLHKTFSKLRFRDENFTESTSNIHVQQKPFYFLRSLLMKSHLTSLPETMAVNRGLSNEEFDRRREDWNSQLPSRDSTIWIICLRLYSDVPSWYSRLLMNMMLDHGELCHSDVIVGQVSQLYSLIRRLKNYSIRAKKLLRARFCSYRKESVYEQTVSESEPKSVVHCKSSCWISLVWTVLLR